MSTLTQKLFVLFQWLVPQHILTSLVFTLARIGNTAIKNFLIRQFVNAYKVNIDELDAAVPEDFATFNAFFTRALAKGARPIDATAGTIVSPVDGTVSAAGAIERDMLFQAKGLKYGLEDLLATDLPETADYINGRFATIYLAPSLWVHSTLQPLAPDAFPHAHCLAGQQTVSPFASAVWQQQDDGRTHVSSPQFSRVEMHETVFSDGVARMRALPSVTVESNTTMEFKTGGKHLMLFSPGKVLLPGRPVVLHIHLASADILIVETTLKTRHSTD